MPINADYDHIDTFNIDPDTLALHGNDLKDLSQAVADSVQRIAGTWKDLQLGWMGKTYDEASDFLDRWNSVMEELFGTKDEPKKGALNAIVTGVLTAATNFAQTEQMLFELFTQFEHDLAGTPLTDLQHTVGHALGGVFGEPTPQSITEVTATAVTEKW
jgi:uncharacterized protein YukE